MAFIKNLTSTQITVRGNKMKLKHLLPIYSFINYLTNICYTPAKALGTMRDCISQGLKSKQMAHSNQDNPKGVYLQKGFVAKVWIRRNCAGTQGQHQHSCHHPWVLKGPEEERAKEAARDRLARSRGPHREGARGTNTLLSLSHRPLIDQVAFLWKLVIFKNSITTKQNITVSK